MTLVIACMLAILVNVLVHELQAWLTLLFKDTCLLAELFWCCVFSKPSVELRYWRQVKTWCAQLTFCPR